MTERIKLIYVFDLLEKGFDLGKIASLVEKKVWIMDAFGRGAQIANDEEKTAVLNELKKFKYYADSPYEDDIDKKELYTLLHKWREADNAILDHLFANACWPSELLDQEKLELIDENKLLSKAEDNKLKEITSLHKMILGMAITKYGYDPNSSKNKCTGDGKFSIHDDLYNCDINLTPDTIRKFLKQAAGNITYKIPDKKT